MFRLFSRKATRGPRRQVDAGAVHEGMVAARVEMESMGALPDDAAEAAEGPQHEPAPEYTAESPTPSEDVWEREEARYRAKNEGDPPD